MSHFAVIAAWDAQLRVSRYNLVDTEAEAIAIINRVRGLPLTDVEKTDLEARLEGETTVNERWHFTNRLL